MYHILVPSLLTVCFVSAHAQNASTDGMVNTESLLQLQHTFVAQPMAVEHDDACQTFATTQSKSDISQKVLGSGGGHWSPCTHLKLYGLNSAPGVGRFLSQQLAPKTSLEFGCGLGLLSDYMRRFSNTDVTCVEPDKALGELLIHTASQSPGGRLTHLAANLLADDNQGARSCATSLTDKKFDLVLCLEVAEHIPHKFHKNLIQLLADSTGKFLVFSGARLGQLGTGHLNESSFSSDYWVKTFVDAGLQYMPKMTQMAQDSGYWGRGYDLYGNIMVMKNPSYQHDDTDSPNVKLSQFKWLSPSNWRKENEKIFEKFRDEEQARLWPELTEMVKEVHEGKIPCDVTGE